MLTFCPLPPRRYIVHYHYYLCIFDYKINYKVDIGEQYSAVTAAGHLDWIINIFFNIMLKKSSSSLAIMSILQKSRKITKKYKNDFQIAVFEDDDASHWCWPPLKATKNDPYKLPYCGTTFRALLLMFCWILQKMHPITLRQGFFLLVYI